MLHDWLCSNGLIVNPKQGKTKFMMFGTAAKRSKITHQTKITIDSKVISNTNRYKYLGIHLDTSLTLNDHIQKICKKSSRRLGLLRRIRPILTTHAAVDLYKAMVQPVMTYCSIVFATLSETNENIVFATLSWTVPWYSPGRLRREHLRAFLESNIKSIVYGDHLYR